MVDSNMKLDLIDTLEGGRLNLKNLKITIKKITKQKNKISRKNGKFSYKTNNCIIFNLKIESRIFLEYFDTLKMNLKYVLIK